MSPRIPPSVNYQDQLVSLPALWNTEPPEGRRLIPIEIQWTAMGGDDLCMNVNLQNNAEMAFSRICSLVVDNSQCGADIQFIFPDTTATLTIPAYTPSAQVPVFTNQKQFYVRALGTVIDSDTSRIQIFNHVPPPVVVPISQEQNIASVGSISFGDASTDVIGSTVSGTLENAFLFMGLNAANSGSGDWQLVDGDGTIFAQGHIEVSSGDKLNITLFELSNAHLRFVNGLKFVCSESANIGALIQVNLYFRTP